MLNIYAVTLRIETEKVLYIPAPDIKTALLSVKGQKFILSNTSTWNHTVKLAGARLSHTECPEPLIKMGQEVFLLNPDTVKVEQGTVVEIIENGTIINTEDTHGMEVRYNIEVRIKTHLNEYSVDFYKDLNRYVFLSLEDITKHLFSNIES